LKKRVWEIAKDLDIKSNRLLDIAKENGFEVNSVFNVLEKDEVLKLQQLGKKLKQGKKLNEFENHEDFKKTELSKEEKNVIQNTSLEKTANLPKQQQNKEILSKQEEIHTQESSKKIETKLEENIKTESKLEKTKIKSIETLEAIQEVKIKNKEEQKQSGQQATKQEIQQKVRQEQKQDIKVDTKKNQQPEQYQEQRQESWNRNNKSSSKFNHSKNSAEGRNKENQQTTYQSRQSSPQNRKRRDGQSREGQSYGAKQGQRPSRDGQESYQFKQNKDRQDSYQPKPSRDGQQSSSVKQYKEKQPSYQPKQNRDMQASYQSKQNKENIPSYQSKQQGKDKDNQIGFSAKPIVDKLEFSRKDKEKGKTSKTDKIDFDRKMKGGKKKGDRFVPKDEMFAYDNDVVMGPTSSRSKKTQIPTTPVHVPPKSIEIQVPIMVKDFSQETGIRANLIIDKIYKNLDIQLDVNSSLSESMVEMLGVEFERNIIIKKEETEEEILLKEILKKDDNAKLVERAPVVTFMGHVDHGKTSLLDRIRRTDVTTQEAGGITQHIGASKIEVNGQSIVFLDTPGHEVFTAMRARGANVTDIVVLVVAADDGVMPQTIEAINHAKAAEVPIIVAINKIDRHNARVDNVYQELSQQGLIPEKWSGSTICVEVSAHTGQGIKELLEYILLVAEMQELKANPKRDAYGTVLEARVVEGRGDVATLLVQNGTLKQSDTILCGVCYGRIRDISNHLGQKIKQAEPSTPVEVCGLSGLPDAGDKFYVMQSLSSARNIAEARKQELREKSLNTQRRPSIEEIMSQIQRGETKELRIVLKADVQGSLEAISAKIQTLTHEEISVKLLHAGVGAVTEGDIQLADASQALIIAFNVTEGKIARDMAEEKGVDIRKYNIIYQLLEDLHKIMTGMLAPAKTEEITGHVTIRKVIHISKIGNVAGCYVTDGYVERTSKIRIYRDGIMLNKDKPLSLDSLKRFKDDVAKVKSGFECGIKIKDFDDIKEGDEIEAYKIVMVERTLDD